MFSPNVGPRVEKFKNTSFASPCEQRGLSWCGQPRLSVTFYPSHPCFMSHNNNNGGSCKRAVLIRLLSVLQLIILLLHFALEQVRFMCTTVYPVPHSVLAHVLQWPESCSAALIKCWIFLRQVCVNKIAPRPKALSSQCSRVNLGLLPTLLRTGL